MRLMLCAMMLCLLLRPQVVMSAASEACHLFVASVLPGLMPYMVLSQMLISRMTRLSPALMMGLGWGGGSPTGARLLTLRPDLPRTAALRIAVSCATMSPMFLLGTVGGWLDSPAAGVVVLLSVIIGGWLAGWAAYLWSAWTASAGRPTPVPTEVRRIQPLSFGAAIDQSARTMLLVCGTMVMLRVFAALAAQALPDVMVLPVTTLLEVTTGTASIASLPLPLAWRTAIIAGATGFGGMAIIMQNRAVMGTSLMPLGQQIIWQTLHGGISFVIALGMMWMM